MLNQALPISSSLFGEAIKQLSLESLYLKTAEIRNSIYHLECSNVHLRPFTESSHGSSSHQPDKDCIDAFKENKIVITRMHQRLNLLKTEVEGRGVNWTEFQRNRKFKDSKDEVMVSHLSDQIEKRNTTFIKLEDESFVDNSISNKEMQKDQRNEPDNILPILNQTPTASHRFEGEGALMGIVGKEGGVFTEAEGINL